MAEHRTATWAQYQRCRDCGCACIIRFGPREASFLCLDCEEAPRWVSAPSALQRLQEMQRG
jgi:hypothetical protein